jgi:soluble lytic murein transglycosylase
VRAPVSLLLLVAGTGLVAAGPPPARARSGAGAAAARTAAPVAELARGFRAYRAGDYPAAIAALEPLLGHGLRNEDWALYLLAESEFYQGDYPTARRHFEKLAAQNAGGRPHDLAPWRSADCLWMAGERAAAGAAYSKLLKHPGAFCDPAVARFRLAELAATRNPPEASRLFMAVNREFPAHPLADEAQRRAAPPKALAPPELAPPERLKRAEALTKDRHWNEALEDLAKLPAELPGTLGAERDYQIGMTKYHMRRDYPRAAELLLAAAPQLTGDRAASAAFHGARALSRVDRDDEAIVGYHKVIVTFPRSRYAAEAQYLSGWLEFNRGRFRESLPDLQATLDHFGKSAFADDAAWCLAFAHYQLGEMDQALAGFERYERLPVADGSADERRARVGYWRARVLEKTGRKAEAIAGYRESLRRGPLSFYGLLARARLRSLGESLPAAAMSMSMSMSDAPGTSLTEGDKPASAVEAFALPDPVGREAAQGDPALARADELLDAGMEVEAGWEIERNESAILRRLGDARGLATLLDRYRRASDFARAYRLAEGRGARALTQEPRGSARVVWEAAFPKAYSALVDTLGPAAGNPDWFLYAIMRKESGFSPADVSYADARGLLQMIPPTSAKVAAAAGTPFFADQLYEPETNVRLGAAYIGSLFRKFAQQIPVAAGSYNAGPKAMGRWCDQHGKHPMDEFVELIAFAQTREYVKRVVGIYARYRYLYGPTPYELPLTVDAKYRADGPDF